MDVEEAKEVIADYLTGRTVPRRQVTEACARIRENGDYERRLKRELGFDPDWISDCCLFLENIDEYLSMTDAARKAELPELIEHVRLCRACRTAYWRIQSAWTECRDAVDSRQSRIRTLAEPIQIAVARGSHLRDLGAGPPAVAPLYVARAAGGDAKKISGDEDEQDENLATSLLWTFHEQEHGFEILVTARVHQTGRVVLDTELAHAEATSLSDRDVYVQLTNQASKSVAFSGSLHDLCEEPLFLAAGTWLLTLSLTDSGGEHLWALPIMITQEHPA